MSGNGEEMPARVSLSRQIHRVGPICAAAMF